MARPVLGSSSATSSPIGCPSQVVRQAERSAASSTPIARQQL
jgi:hypothetical protein